MMNDQSECISEIYEEKEDLVIITTCSSITGDESSDTVQLHQKKTTAAAAATSKGRITSSTLLPTTETDYGQIQRDDHTSVLPLNNSDDDHEEDKKWDVYLRCANSLPFGIIPTKLSNSICHVSNHHRGRIRNIVYCFAGLFGFLYLLFVIGDFSGVDDHFMKDRCPGFCDQYVHEDDQFSDKPPRMSLEELLKSLEDEDDEGEDSVSESEDLLDDLLDEDEVEDLIERLLLLET